MAANVADGDKNCKPPCSHSRQAVGAMSLYASRMSQKMREARKRAGLTLEVVAAKAGLSRPHLNEFELGRKRPREEQIVRIAKALGVHPTELLESGDDLSPFRDIIEDLRSLSPEEVEWVRQLVKTLPKRGGGEGGEGGPLP